MNYTFRTAPHDHWDRRYEKIGLEDLIKTDMMAAISEVMENQKRKVEDMIRNAAADMGVTVEELAQVFDLVTTNDIATNTIRFELVPRKGALEMKDKLINASALERELREKMRRNDLKESDRLEIAAVLAAIQEAPEVETDADH